MLERYDGLGDLVDVIIWLSNLLSVPEESYSRKVSCELK
jgi:hypothetical protein